MSTTCKQMHTGDELSCEPVGKLVEQGFLPGTFVKFSTQTPVLSPSAVATVDRCGNTDWAVGFIITGSMYLEGGFDRKFANVNEKNGLWTPDETVRFTSRDASSEIEFDNNKQLNRMGSGIVTVNLNDTGIYRIYTWEKYNKAYRDSDGASGGELDYSQRIGWPGLYVSDRGLLTVEKEDVNSNPITYVLASQGEDGDGNFLVIVSA